MKINMFVVSLLALVKTMATTFIMFFLLMLVFNDSFEGFNHGEEIFGYIALGLFLYGLVCVIYVFSILLPMYFIDRKNFTAMSVAEGIEHHAPIITLILAVFAGFAVLIAGDNMKEGLVQANFFNTFVMVYSGLIFFEYQVRSAIRKATPTAKPFES